MDCSDDISILDGTAPPSPETVHEDTSKGGGIALFNPCGLAVSATGRVYIADTGHHRVCVLDGDCLRVLAGSGARGYADGQGVEAAFAHPCGLVLDSDGVLFVADCGNHRIRRITPEGVVTSVAGSGAAGHRDGLGSHACFYNPCGIAIDGAARRPPPSSRTLPPLTTAPFSSSAGLNVMYVADYSNNCVRVVSRGGVVGTLSKDGETPLDSPYGIAVTRPDPKTGAAGLICVSSFHSHSLAAITLEGDVSILAGCGAARHADGAGSEAAFHAPNGARAILARLGPIPAQVPRDPDAISARALLSHARSAPPSGLAVDADDVLYVADSGNHCIRRVTPEGVVSTVAGTGDAGIDGSRLNSPCGVCVCCPPGLGPALLVADRQNSCVRTVAVDVLPPVRVVPSTLRADLRRLLDLDLAGDVDRIKVEGEAVFEVQGRRLRASKAVLCVRCEHFRAMFTSGMRECCDASVQIPDVDYTVFRALLDYLLTDELAEAELTVVSVLELMMLANAYGVLRLEQLCEQSVSENLAESNVDDVRSCAQLIGSARLERAAEKFVAANAA